MPEVEVLELGECEERGGYEDVDAEEVEAGVIEEEGVLEGEAAFFVGVHYAGVLDDVDLMEISKCSS